MLIFLIFIAFPLIYSFYLSLHQWSILSPEKQFIGLENYRAVFTSPAARNAFRVTLLYSLSSIPLLTLFSLGLALLLRGPMRGLSAYRTVLFSPVVMSTTVAAIIWSWVFDPNYGPFNYLLGFLGIRGPNWLADPHWALPALIITALWKYVGYYMVIFIAGLQSIPNVYYEAARLDGAGQLRQLWSITLPLLRKTSAFVLVMVTINSFQTFSLVYVMTGGGPMDSTNLVVHYLYREAFEFFRMGYASAVAWLLFIVLFILSLLQIKYIGWGSRPRELSTTPLLKKGA
jgi:multiple sugar transport system permease protein